MLEEKIEKVMIVGKMCELGDVVIKEIYLLKVKLGDFLVVYFMGVYGYLMSSNYNWVIWLVVVFVNNG